MKKFDFEEDYEYFDRLFDSLGGINKNIHLFDFRTPIIKRKEFNKIRNDIFYILMEKKVIFASYNLMRIVQIMQNKLTT